MAASALLLALLAPLSAAEAGTVTGVSVTDSQIIIRFDDVVEKASSFVLAGPNRIALDVVGANTGAKQLASGVVSLVRQSQFNDNTARIVFDLVEPAIISDGRFASDGRSLTLTLQPVAEQRFSASAVSPKKLYLPPEAYRAAPPRSRYNITVPLDGPKSGLPRPRIYGPKGRPLVVIDAGHGGHDPGAISPHGGKREKNVTLAIALAIKDELIAAGRVRVALTREDDRYLVLRERTAIARNLGADLFVSVHADSAGSPDATGATIYTLSEVASDKEAAAYAARENKADVINGVNLGGEKSDIASILVDLAQRESMNASANFAKLMKREASREIRFRPDFMKNAGFAVLKSPDMPSILLEVGYLTNAGDTTRLISGEGQRQIATGMRKAIDIHFAQRTASR